MERQMNSTNYCRERAAACERLAATATSPETREIMIYLARRWRSLAQQDEAERNPLPVRGRSPPLPSGDTVDTHEDGE